jgi:hypothetical protein
MCKLHLSLEASLARGGGWGSLLEEFHRKMKAVIMQTSGMIFSNPN